MIKAVFFDWFNTLANFDPPREELYRKAFLENGFELSCKTIYQGLLVGDRLLLSSEIRKLMHGKKPEEKAQLYTCYTQAIGEAAGLAFQPDLQIRVIQYVLKEYTGAYALFEDTLSTLQNLKQQGLILGLITNADRTVLNLVEKLGAAAFLDIIMTSEQAGAEKPAAPIFLAALQKGNLKSEDCLYVGDQYQSDILGARGVGMRAILIDRYDLDDGSADCPKIKNLKQVQDYLN